MILPVLTRVGIVFACALASLAVPRDPAFTRFGFPLVNYDRIPMLFASVRAQQIGVAAYLEEGWQAGEITQWEKLSYSSDDRWFRLAPGVIGAFSPRAAAINAFAWIGISALGLKLWKIRRRRTNEGVACAQCGYDLTGNLSGRCPECGAVRR